MTPESLRVCVHGILLLTVIVYIYFMATQYVPNVDIVQVSVLCGVSVVTGIAAWFKSYKNFSLNLWIITFTAFFQNICGSSPLPYRLASLIMLVQISTCLAFLNLNDMFQLKFIGVCIVYLLLMSLMSLQAWPLCLPVLSLLACNGILFWYSRKNIRSLEERLKEKEKENLELREEIRILNASNASVAHELRNPLNSLLGSLTLLNSSKLGDKKDVQDYLDSAKSSGQILMGLIGSLLDSSKLRANGKLEMSYTYVDLKEFIEKIMALTNIQARAKNLTLTFETSPSFPDFVHMDQERISQILLNFLGNAVKFTPSQGHILLYVQWISKVPGQEPVVESHLNVARQLKQDEPNPSGLKGKVLFKRLKPLVAYESHQEGYIYVHVIDTGIGLTTEEQGRLFEPFAQANTQINQKFGGTGIGLWVSKKIIESMGGKIILNSEKGIGSEFMVMFPSKVGFLNGKSPIPVTPNSLKRSLAEINSYLKDKHILIVQSDVNSSYENKHLFEDFGVKVELSNNSTKALNIRRAKGLSYFDLMLIDMSMEMNEGFKTYSVLRNEETCRGDRPSFIILLDKQHLINEDVELQRNNGISSSDQPEEVAYETKIRILEDVKHGFCVILKEKLDTKLLTEISFRIKSRITKSHFSKNRGVGSYQPLNVFKGNDLTEAQRPSTRMIKISSSPKVIGLPSFRLPKESDYCDETIQTVKTPRLRNEVENTSKDQLSNITEHLEDLGSKNSFKQDSYKKSPQAGEETKQEVKKELPANAKKAMKFLKNLELSKVPQFGEVREPQPNGNQLNTMKMSPTFSGLLPSTPPNLLSNGNSSPSKNALNKTKNLLKESVGAANNNSATQGQANLSFEDAAKYSNAIIQGNANQNSHKQVNGLQRNVSSPPPQETQAAPVPAPNSSVVHIPMKSSAPQPAANNNPVCVMIVDDDIFSAKTVEGFVKKKHASYKICHNGQEAVDEMTANYNLYHTIIMDCEMPILDGYKATEGIRALERERYPNRTQIPIFGVSGNVGEEYTNMAMKAGMTAYYHKPLDMNKVTNEILEKAISYKIANIFQ